MKVIFTVGISASGKSTWARNYIATEWEKDRDARWYNICRDDIRDVILKEKSRHGDVEFSWAAWNWKWENTVSLYQQERIDAALKDPTCAGIIISDTNLNKDRLDNFIQSFVHKGVPFENIEIKYFPIDIETAWKRDAARQNGVGHDVIAKQFRDWSKFQESIQGNLTDKYIPNKRMPSAVMVDIDGTLAHMNGKRGPFEWHKVGVDDCDVIVKETIRGLYNQGFCILILSGRDGVCEQETIDWLESNDIFYHKLFMRKAGDMRKDTIVKKEIFDNHIRYSFNVMAVFDDRPAVCRQWLDLGVKTFILGNPWIEF